MIQILHGLIRHTYLLWTFRSEVLNLPHNSTLATIIVAFTGIIFFPLLILPCALFLPALILFKLRPALIRFLVGTTLIYSGYCALTLVSAEFDIGDKTHPVIKGWMMVCILFFWHKWCLEDNHE